MSTLIYLDSWIAIVAKDAGEPVQTRETSQDTIVKTVRKRLGDSWLQAVHRIDQPVSGAVVLARDKDTFTRLQTAINRGEMHRAYLAVVDSPPVPEEGILEDYLLVADQKGASRSERRTRVVSADTPGARHSVLRYRTIGTTDHHTIVLIELQTGRHHQIRAQLANRGSHVVGDALYGARRPMRDRSIALHAWYVSVPHPDTSMNDRVTCTADLPATALWRGVKSALLPAL